MIIQVKTKRGRPEEKVCVCNLCGTKENLIGVRRPISTMLIEEPATDKSTIHICDHCLTAMVKLAELRRSIQTTNGHGMTFQKLGVDIKRLIDSFNEGE